MKGIIVIGLAVSLMSASFAQANLLDKVKESRQNKRDRGGELDSKTIAAGLKEALSVGAKNSVKDVSKENGYFGNQLIKIPMPEKIRKIEKKMRKAGFRREADKFVLSMNRAAEKAAPKALSFFVDAVKKMTINDAAGILRGNDTAATDFLKSKTHDRIYKSFKPIVSSTMKEVGVTRSFKEMMDKARTIPLLKRESVDLDQYVTSKALDGLFVVVGQEEKKIRKEPAARVTELLKKVFK